MGKTLLVVDDNPVSRAGLSAFLGREGYAVAQASNGREALDYLRSNPAPDLILLDMMMPGVDGWAFLHERERDYALTPIPVIVMTALAVASREWAASIGACGFVHLPADMRDVLAEVRRCLGEA